MVNDVIDFYAQHSGSTVAFPRHLSVFRWFLDSEEPHRGRRLFGQPGALRQTKAVEDGDLAAVEVD